MEIKSKSQSIKFKRKNIYIFFKIWIFFRETDRFHCGGRKKICQKVSRPAAAFSDDSEASLTEFLIGPPRDPTPLKFLQNNRDLLLFRRNPHRRPFAGASAAADPWCFWYESWLVLWKQRRFQKNRFEYVVGEGAVDHRRFVDGTGCGGPVRRRAFGELGSVKDRCWRRDVRRRRRFFTGKWWRWMSGEVG